VIYQEQSLEILERTKKLTDAIVDVIRNDNFSDTEVSTVLSMLLIDLNMYEGFNEETFIEKVRGAWRLIEKAKKEGK
jgi:hypothetical protein